MENQVVSEEIIGNQKYSAKLKTLIERFYEWEQKQPNKVFLRQPVNNTWKDYTWKEAADQVRRMATAIKSLNFPPHSKIGIISKNCAHWIFNDLAITLAGHISVPFYPNLTAVQLNQLLLHCDAKALFVGKLDNWQAMDENIPSDIIRIAYPHYTGNAKIEGENYLKWDDLIAKNEPQKENYVPALEDLFTIIYTSGTTGNPKGVMFDFYRVTSTMEEAAPYLLMNDTNNRFFSYMPLCHIAERAFVEAGCIFSGGTIYFAESLETFAKNLQESQPTHFLAVPRIWVKFQLGVLSKLPQKKLNFLTSIPVLSGMVKRKIRKGLGLDSAKIVVTAAAPMPVTVITWFKKMGIFIQEVYGMTENGGGCTYMPAEKVKNGTVGKPYHFVQVKIDSANSEILMKSEGVMLGYYREPEMTQETFKDGWLRTGDMGELDKEGYLKITGRVKELFKTSKGEYVAPGPIEWKFAANNDIEQICVMGNGLPQPVALLVLSDIGKAKSQEEVKQALIEQLSGINKELVQYQQVKTIVVMKEPWTIENGLLTPTLKIKRNKLEEKVNQYLEKWYEHPEVVLFE